MPRSAHAAATAAQCALCTPPHVTWRKADGSGAFPAPSGWLALCVRRAAQMHSNINTHAQVCMMCSWMHVSAYRRDLLYHVAYACLFQRGQQRIQLAQLIAAQDWVQQVILDDLEAGAFGVASHSPHLR